jgi:indolepyruvate ferredoxin oxidoreductase, beta subunit
VNGTTTVSLAGVGGQGIILGAAVLANAAMIAGYDVKASEVKGMAQRGGSVVSTVRFGRQVWSPVSPRADVVIAVELLEGRRSLDLLADGGTLVHATTVIAPGSVLRGEKTYPDDIAAAAASRGVRIISVDADALAVAAGTSRAANVALLGAASVVLPFTDEHWARALELVVPAKILEVNRRAFDLGRESVRDEEVGT